MKTIDTYITEKLKIRKVTRNYKYKPKTREELIELVKMRMRNEGSDCDLNDIDTSLITDMSRIFAFSAFCGNISKWDVSNVTNMQWMFASASAFNQPIDNWDVSGVNDMSYMFDSAREFNQPIGDWDVSNVIAMVSMFENAGKFN